MDSAPSRPVPVKVLAFMEATVVNGAARSLLNFCEAVNGSAGGRAAEISIATFHRGPIEPGVPANEFVRAVESQGIRAIVIPERHAFDRSVLHAMRVIASEIDPDIIQTNNVKSHLLVRLAGLNRGRRWIAFHHGYTATDLKVKLYNQVDRWSLRAPDRVVAVCGPFQQQLAALGIPERNIRVLHNSAAVLGRPAADVEGTRRHFRLEEGTKVLVAIGRLSFEKGHADLIRALDRLRRSKPLLQWKLLLVGSGPEQKNLQTLMRHFGLGDYIIFTGHQNNILSFLQVSDLMVLPSHSEGSPHVVLEAMSAGVPVVATRVGGIPEILTDGETAVLVPARNAPALADAIAGILGSPEKARSLAARAREVLREKFSHEAYKDGLLGIYREVLCR